MQEEVGLDSYNMQVQRFLEEQYRLVAHRAQVRRHQNNGSGNAGTGAGDRQGELGGAGLAEVLKHALDPATSSMHAKDLSPGARMRCPAVQ